MKYNYSIIRFKSIHDNAKELLNGVSLETAKFYKDQLNEVNKITGLKRIYVITKNEVHCD